MLKINRTMLMLLCATTTVVLLLLYSFHFSQSSFTTSHVVNNASRNTNANSFENVLNQTNKPITVSVPAPQSSSVILSNNDDLHGKRALNVLDSTNQAPDFFRVDLNSGPDAYAAVKPDKQTIFFVNGNGTTTWAANFIDHLKKTTNSIVGGEKISAMGLVDGNLEVTVGGKNYPLIIRPDDPRNHPNNSLKGVSLDKKPAGI